MNKNNNDKKEKENPSLEQSPSSSYNGENQKDITNQTNAAEVNESKESTVKTKPEELEKRINELNDKYIRLYADFENYRKRVSKERIDLLRFAGEDIFKQLLPVMDDFERAIKAAAQTTDFETIKQGEQLIYNKLKIMLTQNGLQEMNVAGQPFDSELHDAITNIPAPSEDMKGKVTEEVEKGYYLNGKVIRHAKVIVGN